MAFRTNAAPYQRAKNSTLRIMLILTIALIIVWACGIIYSFQLDGAVNAFIAELNAKAIEFNEKYAAQIANGKKEAKEVLDLVNYGVRAILMVVIALITTAACDVVNTLIRHKKDSKLSLGKEIVYDLVHNYSYVTAIIFALTLPVYTSYYVVIVGSIFATVVCKLVFGGFGKNIFNPAIMARIFVGLCFAGALGVPEIIAQANAGVIVTETADAVTGATLTTAFNGSTGWLDSTRNGVLATIHGSIFADFSMMDMLLGKYVGALGETFTLVILALGIVLSVLKVINWRTPVFYLGTVALTALVIALVLGLSNPFQYVIYHLSLGGLMFGAVFMLTDPVTGPTSSFGKSFVAVFAGLMTMLIRVKGGYPEGVMFSIALANFISPAVDYLTTGKTSSHLIRKCCVVFGTLLVSIGLCTGLAWNLNGGREVYAINGIDVVEYTLLEETLPLQEGHYFERNENYTAKTDAVKAYVLDAENNTAFDASYLIVDENGELVATVYSIKATGVINNHYSDIDVTSYALVGIKVDGTIYSVGALTPLNTSKYAAEGAVNEYANNNFVGYNESNYSGVEVLSGSTYSSDFIKKIIGLAYAEHNA